jgi:hypothetical protein
MEEAKEEVESPTCRCGFAMGHGLIRRTPKYTVMGWVTLLWGVTVTPKRIDYQCMRCEEVIHTVRSDVELQREA